MHHFSIGLDYGTNSVRALVVDTEDGREIATSVWEYAHGDHGVVIDVKGQPVPEDTDEDEETDDAEAAAQVEDSETTAEEEPDQNAQSDTSYARHSR